MLQMPRDDRTGEAWTPSEAAGPRRRPDLPWSWPDEARALLGGLAIVAALGLFAVSRNAGRQPQPPMPSPRPLASAAPRPEARLVLDPNTATPEALAALPYLGPTLSRRIAEARTQGPFRSLEDLRARVRGIGPVTLTRISPYLRLDPATMTDVRYLASTGAGSDSPAGSEAPARKPPRSRSRKPRGASVQLVAKGGTNEPQRPLEPQASLESSREGID